MATADEDRPLRIVDLFAGPGGLDTAALALDIPTIGVEWDDGACATREREGHATEQGDVRDFGPDDFPSANVLVGGPPCQTFTVAGHGAGRRALDQVFTFADRLARRDDPALVRADLKALSDERTGLVLEPLRWALQAQDAGRPYQAIVLEQVPAVLPVWRVYGEILRTNGYTVAEPAILHTEQYGVPQTRRRAILIARWTGRGAMLPTGVRLPEPTHCRYSAGAKQSRQTMLDGVAPWISMGEALRRYRSEAFEVVSNYGTGGDPKARGRRRSDEPAATVTGKVSRNRVIALDGSELPRFSQNEAGILQSFPDGYRWCGSDVAQQIGNAVPPRLGVHVLAAALALPRDRVAAALGRLATPRVKSG